MVRFVVLLGLGLLLGAGCRKPLPPPPAAPDLCAGRARCEVTRRRFSTPDTKHHVVDLRILHAPGAEADEDRCDRREYWLVGGAHPLLLAADCETQWGADTLGPAATQIDGARFVVHYEEFESSDLCEAVDATLSLRDGAVVTQSRRLGADDKRGHCLQQEPAEALPGGDGSAEKPLLTLHR